MRLIAALTLVTALASACGSGDDASQTGPGDGGQNELACAQATDYQQQLQTLHSKFPTSGDPFSPEGLSYNTRQAQAENSERQRLTALATAAEASCGEGD